LAPYFSQVSFPPGGQADVVEFLRHSRPLNSSALVLMRRSVPSVVIWVSRNPKSSTGTPPRPRRQHYSRVRSSPAQ